MTDLMIPFMILW